MKRPIGVTLLAIGAGLLALFEIWRTLVFLGIVNWTFLGKEVSFPEAQWGPAIWAIILAAIWIYVAEGFWNVRAYAWTFGIFISIFTIIFGFFAIMGNGTTTEAEIVRLVAGDHHLLLPQLPRRSERLRRARDVAPDAGTACCDAEGRGGERSGSCSHGQAAAPAPRRRRRPPAPPAPPAS